MSIDSINNDNSIPERDDYINRDVDRYFIKNSLTEKIKHYAITFFKNTIYLTGIVLSYARYVFSRTNAYCKLPKEKIPNYDYGWKPDNKGLYVFVTGLLGHPIWADKHRLQLRKDQPDMEVRIPFVYQGGNCSLADAATPISDMVNDYIEKFPGNPICLIGTSNGGRISLEVERRARGKGAAIRVSAASGIFFGSTVIDRLKKIKPVRFLLKPILLEELSTGSETAKALIKAVKQPLVGKDKRSYEFFAAKHDNCIPNFDSCFPKIGENPQYILKHNETHMSIMDAARQEQLANARPWMESHRVVNYSV
ncbi:MAG: hypothetical protein JHC93_01855 [Parachlamydiales bacterium]|nr:hypothetical protein [Parachlamydiales bacterium]